MERTLQSLHGRIENEPDMALDFRMYFPVSWDPFFRDTMTVSDVYHFGTQHFDHHRRQLTLPSPDDSGASPRLG